MVDQFYIMRLGGGGQNGGWWRHQLRAVDWQRLRQAVQCIRMVPTSYVSRSGGNGICESWYMFVGNN